MQRDKKQDLQVRPEKLVKADLAPSVHKVAASLTNRQQKEYQNQLPSDIVLHKRTRACEIQQAVVLQLKRSEHNSW
jgi:hypothetical protein